MTLAEFQTWLKKHKIDAYYLTRNNMFLDEDILPEENKIMALTGFSGSAGNLIITPEKAFLFVDGRYQLQAGLETDSETVEILCTVAASPHSWLRQNFSNNRHRIMYDPWCLAAEELERLVRDLPGTKFIADDKQLPGPRLSEKSAHVFELGEQYAGVSREEKISGLLQTMAAHNLDAYLITSASEVSWLLNLRSDALPDSPVVRAYALIKKDGSAVLFGEHLDYSGIRSFAELGKALKKIRKGRLGVSYHRMPQIISELRGPDICLTPDALEKDKAVKNPVEIQGFKKAHQRDAVAMIEFLFWLENNWQGKTELDIVEKIDSLRRKQDLYYAKSFDTIAGTGSNGAVIHYHPTVKTNKTLEKNSVLLLDSGAHYFDGTTDITRTIALGTPAPDIINDNTMVLKAHIELASTLFPTGTPGRALDPICRRELWNEGKNYAHGTGHGVGFMLNVHEGPQNISAAGSSYGFLPGMVTSIEPGYYKENAYGIRIENLYYVTEAADKNLENPMLKFEVLTLVPIDKRLINKYLLSEGEIKWLNDYHQKVLTAIGPLLDNGPAEWLREACSPL